ncbi:hypothetical protein HZ326_1955 [Fusarium oxysporum f. sp. albedinis]|nr:hypothetical protein HZ326_1955 [Fusarium oxysporum f. sp. albedinis]
MRLISNGEVWCGTLSITAYVPPMLTVCTSNHTPVAFPPNSAPRSNSFLFVSHLQGPADYSLWQPPPLSITKDSEPPRRY